MPRVLLIAFRYPPSEAIGAMRPAGLAKYLPQFGWQVTVLTPRVKDRAADPKVIETGYQDVIANWKSRLGLDAKVGVHQQLGLPVSSKPRSSLLHTYALDLAKYVIAYPDETKGWIPFALKEIEQLRDQQAQQPKIDAILTTAPPVTAHLIGCKAKQILGCPWVADFRDLWSQNLASPHPVLKSLQAGLERRTLKTADVLVTVSRPWAERLQEHHPARTVLTIENGFDPDHFKSVSKELTRKFTITYAGRLYQGQRDPKLLFEVLADLVNEEVMQPGDVQVRFYGPVEPWITAQVQQYGLDQMVAINGLVTRDESLQRQAESQVLLLLGWANPRETGQHSGKLFEYFGASRPILAIGGSHGVLTEALDETHAGVHALSKEQVRNFLLTAYGEFKAKGYVAYQGEETAINRYTHFRMARQFAELLSSVSDTAQPSEVAVGAARESELVIGPCHRLTRK